MPLDTSIPYNVSVPQFNVAPAQVGGPTNMLTDVMRLKGLQQEQQLNQLKAQEYQLQMQDRQRARNEAAAARAEKVANDKALINALRDSVVGNAGPLQPDARIAANALLGQGKLGPAITALGASEAFTKDTKAKSDLAKVDTEIVDKNLATFRTFAPGVNSPEAAAIYARAMYDNPTLGPLMQQTGYDKEAAAAKAAQDYAADPQRWMAAHVGLTGEQVMKSLQPQQRPVAAAPVQAPMTTPITSAAFNAQGASPVQLAMLGGVGASPLLQMARPLPSGGGVTAPGPSEDNALSPTKTASRKPAAADSGLPPGLKLKQGERYNAEADRVESVPGSDLYIAQSQKHQKDARAVEGVASKMDDAVANINEMLSDKNKEGFDNNFGGYSAYATNKFTGNTAKVKSMLEKFNSNMKAAGLELFRTGGSIGAMTEKEWPIVQNEIAALSPTMDVEDARLAMTKIASRLQRIRDNAHEIYGDTWSQTQFYKKPKNATSSDGWTIKEH